MELPFMISSSYSRGKSLFLLNKFEKWYADGNRIPSGVSVEIFDLEGSFSDLENASLEEKTRTFNLIYFLCEYGGGYHNARIVKHGINE